MFKLQLKNPNTKRMLKNQKKNLTKLRAIAKKAKKNIKAGKKEERRNGTTKKKKRRENPSIKKMRMMKKKNPKTVKKAINLHSDTANDFHTFRILLTNVSDLTI